MLYSCALHLQLRPQSADPAPLPAAAGALGAGFGALRLQMYCQDVFPRYIARLQQLLAQQQAGDVAAASGLEQLVTWRVGAQHAFVLARWAATGLRCTRQQRHGCACRALQPAAP